MIITMIFSIWQRKHKESKWKTSESISNENYRTISEAAYNKAIKKGNLWNGKKYLQTTHLANNEYPKYIRNSYNLIVEKPNNPIEKWTKGEAKAKEEKDLPTDEVLKNSKER